MKKNPAISVIVPVYNSEKWLRRCIQSILAQTYQDFELLLIDDGSNDGSNKICDEYSAKDSRVRVFHKPNGGVSSARNLGLDNARGEWISFVDSDDWMSETGLSDLYDANVDFSMSNYKAIEWKGWEKQVFDERSFIGEEINDFLDRYLISCNTPWAKLYKNSIIKIQNIRFNEKLSYGEDTLFVIDFLKYVDSIKLTDSVTYYYYCGNFNSLSNKVDIESVLLLVDSISDSIIRLSKYREWDCIKTKNSIIRLISNRLIESIDYSSKNAISKLRQVCCNLNIQQVIKDRSILKSRARTFFDFLVSNKFYKLIILIMRIKYGKKK